MTAPGARHRPRAAGVAPFVDHHALAAGRAAPATSGSTCTRVRRPSLFPALGAYVGGDIVAGMLATGMDRDKRIRLFIDVGTNCEIVLSDGDRRLHRGARRAGVRGRRDPVRHARAPTARSRCVKHPRTARSPWQVIGDVEPRGLCGSGLVDAVAELVTVGLLDHSGRFVPDERRPRIAPALADRLTKIGKERVFVLAPARADADPERLRLPLPARRARAAVRQGRDLDRLDAAARGARARARRRPAGAARRLVRQLPLRRRAPSGSGWCRSCRCCASSSAGNVAGEGAKMALLSLRERAGALAPARR